MPTRRRIEWTDVESFAVLEPMADGFRNFLSGREVHVSPNELAGRPSTAVDAYRSGDDGPASAACACSGYQPSTVDAARGPHVKRPGSADERLLREPARHGDTQWKKSSSVDEHVSTRAAIASRAKIKWTATSGRSGVRIELATSRRSRKSTPATDSRQRKFVDDFVAGLEQGDEPGPLRPELRRSNPRADARFTGPDDPELASVRRVNIGSVRAGLGRELHDWRPGQVPDFATIRMSVRYGPGQSESSVIADIERELADLSKADPRIRTEVHSRKREGLPPPRAFHVDQNEPVVRAVQQAYESAVGQKPPIGAVPPYRYYGSDASHLQHLAGMKGVVCGAGGKYNTMPDERVELSQFRDATRLYLLTARDVCG